MEPDIERNEKYYANIEITDEQGDNYKYLLEESGIISQKGLEEHVGNVRNALLNHARTVRKIMGEPISVNYTLDVLRSKTK